MKEFNDKIHQEIIDNHALLDREAMELFEKLRKMNNEAKPCNSMRLIGEPVGMLRESLRPSRCLCWLKFVDNE